MVVSLSTKATTCRCHLVDWIYFTRCCGLAADWPVTEGGARGRRYAMTSGFVRAQSDSIRYRTVFNHVGLCVADGSRSRRFYEGLLGFEFWWELEPPDEGT